jgi:hypothetical protein
LSEPIPDIEPLDALRAEWEKAHALGLHLSVLIKGVVLADKDMREASQKAVQLEERFHEEMGDVCPLCDQKL